MKPHVFKVGQHVLINWPTKQLGWRAWQGPYEVTGLIGPVDVKVNRRDVKGGEYTVIHNNHVKLYTEPYADDSVPAASTD